MSAHVTTPRFVSTFLIPVSRSVPGILIGSSLGRLIPTELCVNGDSNASQHTMLDENDTVAL